MPKATESNIERSEFPLPDGFDPARHTVRLRELVASKVGDGWRVHTIDTGRKVAILVRENKVAQVKEGSKADVREVNLPDDAKPSDGAKWAATLADENPGYHMVLYDPFLNRAILEKMSVAALRCREAVAGALSAKEWEVIVRPRPGGGFDMVLPKNYLPSKHEEKLTEVAQEVVGNLGWSVRVDAAKRRAVFIAGEPPVFDPMIPYPFDLNPPKFDPAKDDWATLPLGEILGGQPYVTDFTAAPHRAVSGTSGGGKWEPLTNRVPVPISAKFPQGWATIGEIDCGDHVYGIDGQIVEVLGTSAIEPQPTMIVGLDDGQKITVGHKHLWRVSAAEARRLHDRWEDEGRPGTQPEAQVEALRLISASTKIDRGVTGTRQWIIDKLHVTPTLIDEVLAASGEAIQTSISDDGSPEFPVDEVLYLAARHAVAHSAGLPPVEQIVDTRNLHANHESLGYSIEMPVPVPGSYERLPMSPWIFGHWLMSEDTAPGAVGVAEVMAGIGATDENPIPAVYLRTSVAQRRELLNSLMMSSRDVPVTDRSLVRLKMRTSGMADSVLELVRSLGIRATAEHDDSGLWVTFSLEPDRDGLAITSVESDGQVDEQGEGEAEGQVDGKCLYVDHSSGMYLTGGFVPTHNSILLQSLITGALARGWDLVVIDPIKGGVDFSPFRDYVRDSGWGCETMEEGVTALQLAYEEGVRRKTMVRDHKVQKWTEIPKALGVRPVLVVTDEVSSFLMLEQVPKLPKDHPLVMEVQGRNACKAQAGILMGKIARELRFVGVHLVVSSQVSQAATGVSTELRANLGEKFLLGVNPTDGNRRLALNNPDAVPKVPGYIASDKAMSRGVGVFEREGTPSAGVLKGYFASLEQFGGHLKDIGLSRTASPRPTQAEINRCAPTSTDIGENEPGGRENDESPFGGDSSFSDGGRKRKKTPAAASVGVGGGGGTADFGPTKTCNTCDGPINPLTSECRCSG